MCMHALKKILLSTMKQVRPVLLQAGAAALAIGMIGLFSVWSSMPWLFPSLGPSVAIQVGSPHQSVAKPRNVLGGHLIGLMSALIAVHVTGASAAPPLGGGHPIMLARAAAAALAMLLSLVAQYMLDARHPPAESTTLVVALGAVQPDAKGVLSIVVGAALVTVTGEALRQYFAWRSDAEPE